MTQLNLSLGSEKRAMKLPPCRPRYLHWACMDAMRDENRWLSCCPKCWALMKAPKIRVHLSAEARKPFRAADCS